MGHIYKRGHTYWIKYHKDSRPYYESSRSTTKAVARALLKKREGEIADGRLPGVVFEKVKFDDLVKMMLADYRQNNRKSTKRIKLSIGHLKDFFGGMRVPAITTERVSDYVEERLAYGAANATINRESAALKRMFNLGVRHGKVNPVTKPYIKMLEENNVRKGFFEHAEFLVLRDALPSHLKVFCTFAYKVGWRISEIATIKWSQIDLEQRVVRLEVGTTKNNEGRTVYLDEELHEMLKGMSKQRANLLPWVFLNEHGADRVKRFDKAWKSACKKAKIGVRHFHDFRRTAVRNMVRAGIPERVAMEVSGHKTRAVFERYNIVADADLRMAAQRQAEYLETQNRYNLVTIENLDKKREASQKTQPPENTPKSSMCACSSAG